MTQTQNIEATTPTTLVAMQRELAFIEQQLIESGGELTPELDAWYTEVAGQAERKLDAIKFVADSLDATATALKAQAELFSAAAKARTNTAARVKDIIKQGMQMRGTTELNGNLYRAKLTNTAPRLVVTNEEQIPQEFFYMEPTLNKEALTRALKSGIPVTGAELQESKALRFYVQTGGGK